ncbi:MAG: hypothetical protein Q9227_006654 [Pyrenula ochraceoflavens]
MPLPNEVNDIVQRIDDYARSGQTPTEEGRQALHHAARKLLEATEKPQDVAWRFALSPLSQACMCAAWRCQILHPWPQQRMTSADLASRTNVNKKLVMRLMRALTAYNVFTEVEEEVYEHTALSKALSTDPLAQTLQPMAQRILGSTSKLPDYLQSISYRNPGDDSKDKTLFSFANNTDLNFFQWLEQRPEALAAFDKSMASSIAMERNSADKGLASIFPFESELGNLSDGNEVTLVDVGGGYGHVLEDIHTYLPNLKGRMVLEDLPRTIEKATHLDRIEKIPYDFMMEQQPIKAILRNTRPAMARDKSRLLIVEVVLPPTSPTLWGAMMDINIMRYSGAVRKESQWRDLLASAGFAIVKIWPPVQNDSVIEAVPTEWL